MIDVKEKISSFFIFNSDYGPIEGEELKKILFYYPNNVSPDARKIQVGLCEAVIKFMSTFSSEPCDALQTQSKRHIFYQPERGFWMVMIVRIPYVTNTLSSTAESSDVIEPSVVKDFLVSAYNMFKMFVGSFSNIEVENLYSKCKQFFEAFMTSRSLTNDISEIIQGISYLPLDRNSFLNVMCFIDLIEVNYPDFTCVSFMYNDQLIWNSLSTNDMLTLYQYLVRELLPQQVEKEIQGGAVAAAQRHGRFISPPDGIRSSEDLEKITKVYLNQDGDVKQYYLVIYRTLSATICFSIDVNKTLAVETFKSVDAFIGPQLSGVASSLSEQCAAHAVAAAHAAHAAPALCAADTRFIYFNRLNLAFKTSPPPNKLVPSTTVKPEVLSILSGMHADKQSLGKYGEIIIKTPDEYWITGKSSNEREFYVITQKKNATLKDIADAVKRVCDAQMKGIFFYPI